MLRKVPYMSYFNQLGQAGRFIDSLMFQDPGVGVWDEDCVQAGCERWVDIGLGGVANHPCRARLAAVPLDQITIRCFILLSENFHRREEWA